MSMWWDAQATIESDSPHCLLGYYGPYRTTAEAAACAESMARTDPTIRLVWRTEAQRDERMALVRARRRRAGTASNVI